MQNRIREQREKRGLTVEQLAHEAGLSPSYVSRLENSRRNLSLKNVEKLAAALNVRGSELLSDASDPASDPIERLSQLLRDASIQIAESFAGPNIAEEWREILDEGFRTLKSRRRLQETGKATQEDGAESGPAISPPSRKRH